MKTKNERILGITHDVYGYSLLVMFASMAATLFFVVYEVQPKILVFSLSLISIISLLVVIFSAVLRRKCRRRLSGKNKSPC